MDNKLRIIIYSLITLLLSSCIGLDGCNDWVTPTACEVGRRNAAKRTAKMKIYQKEYHMTKEQAEQRIEYEACMYVKEYVEKEGKRYDGPPCD